MLFDIWCLIIVISLSHGQVTDNIWPTSTGQASVPIHRLSTLQRPVFLLNSRLASFTAPRPQGGKLEIINSKSETIFKILNPNLSNFFEFEILDIRICLVFRISCFEFPVPRTGRTSTKGTSSCIAEFLKEGFPARLGTLIPVHLCRFRYGFGKIS